MPCSRRISELLGYNGTSSAVCLEASAGNHTPTNSNAEITPPAKGSALGRIMLSKQSQTRDRPVPEKRGNVRAPQLPFPLVRGQHPQAAHQLVRDRGLIHFQKALAEMVRRLKPRIAGSAGISGAPARSLAPRRSLPPSRSDETISNGFVQLIASLSRCGRQSKNAAASAGSSEFFPQSLAAPQDSGLHSSQGDAQNLRDFLVTHVRNVP